MKLRIMSDLHLDLHPDYGKVFVEKYFGPENKEEILILAGDICSLAPEHEEKTLNLFRSMAQHHQYVLYVAGNHEFWGTDREAALKTLRRLELRIDNVLVLRNNGITEIDGKRFLGDTMWFPFNPDNQFYERNMPDFQQIHNLRDWVYKENAEFTAFLRRECKSGDIVVTHHMPSFKSVPERYQNSQINRFFVSDQRKVIEKNRPGLFIHGHTHTRFDYRLGDTRIVCNPRGYIGEQSVHHWDPNFRVEV